LSLPKGWIFPSKAKERCPYYNECFFNHDCEKQAFIVAPKICKAMENLIRRGLVKVE
jgi:hypothetical protein